VDRTIATSVITTRSPYIVRVSHTLPQDTQPMAQWAAKNGIKRVFTLVSDFGPGIDAETTFVKAFKAAGGEIVDSVRSPLSNNDFAPFLQRIKDSRPEAIFVFLPPGSQTIAFIKGYEERGLKQAGIRIIATGDLTDDGVLQAMGDPTLGLITSFHYSAAHDSPENKAFLKAYVETNGTRLRPNFMACAGYDGMAAIAEALKKTGGSVDAEKFLAAFKGMRLTSDSDSDAPRQDRSPQCVHNAKHAANGRRDLTLTTFHRTHQADYGALRSKEDDDRTRYRIGTDQSRRDGSRTRRAGAAHPRPGRCRGRRSGGPS